MLLRSLRIGSPVPLFGPNDPPSGGTTPPGGGGTPPATPSGGAPPTPSATPSAAPSSAPSPSPTSTPAPSPAAGGVGETGATELDFSSIFGDGPEPAPGATPAATPIATPPTPAAAPQPPPVGAEPPKPAATPKPEPVAPAVPSPTVTPPPGAPPTAAAPTLDPYDPLALASELSKNEAMATEHVANTLFKLSAEDVEALEANVVETVPKLLARAFVKSQMVLLRQMGQMVPVMMQRQNKAIERNEKNSEAFYSRWPDIKKAEHGDLVNSYGAVYRQMHPDATKEQMIEILGPMVMMAAKIVPSGPSAAPKANGNPVATPTTAGRPPQPPPFVPATGGGAEVAPTGPGQEPWEAMFNQPEG